MNYVHNDIINRSWSRSVASLGGIAQGGTLQGVTPKRNKTKFEAEFTKNSKLKRSSRCRRRRLEKVVTFFRKKIGVTPPVAAPGDTDLSDATEAVDDNEMNEWMKVHCTDLEPALSNTPCKQIQPLSRIKTLNGPTVRGIGLTQDWT